MATSGRARPKACSIVSFRGATGSSRSSTFGASVMAIAEDAHGDLWIGTRGAGLVHLRREASPAVHGGGRALRELHLERARGSQRHHLGRHLRLGREPAGRTVRFVSLPGPRGPRLRRHFLALPGSRRRDLDRHVRRGRDAAGGRGTFHDVYDEGRPGTRRRHVDLPGRRGNVLVRDAGRALLGTAAAASPPTASAKGFFHDAAQRVLEDGRGYLWLTSNRGVFRVSTAELAAVGVRSRARSATT